MAAAKPPAESALGGAPRPQPRRLTALLLNWFFRSATVTQVEVLSDRFRLLTLAGPALKDVAWIPGQKIQIDIGNVSLRTFTPMSWDAAAGVTRILVYLHGAGPGSAWAAGVKPGDPSPIFGPRGSLDLGQLARPAVIFGDETSLGLVYAVHATSGLDHVTVLLEVVSLAETQPVLQTLGLAGVTLVQSAPNAAHLAEVETRVLQALDGHPATQVVLTGSAASILRIRQALRPRHWPASQLKVKAYWAAGKTGLD